MPWHGAAATHLGSVLGNIRVTAKKSARSGFFSGRFDILKRMQQRYLLPFIAFLGLLILALQCIALWLFLYWQFWWLDIVQHSLGGLWVSLALAWFFFVSRYVSHGAAPTLLSVFCVTVLGTLIIGSLWEVFEYSLGLSTDAQGYVFDTVSDVICDVAGGFLGYLIFSRR